MKIKFDKMFDVIFEHQYFRDGKISQLYIEPAQITRSLLRDYGLLFKQTKHGFIILYEKDTTVINEPPLKTISKDLKFSFAVFLNSSYFANYTEIPLHHKYPDIFYFNNLGGYADGTGIFLNKQAFAGNSDVLELYSPVLNLHAATTKPSSLVQLAGPEGKILFSENIKSTEGAVIYQFNFEKIGSGSFDILIDGIIYRKIYVDSELSRKSLFAILDIFVSSGVPANYRFINDDGTVNNKTYKIRFARRETTWKYFIILKNISSDPGLNVHYGTKIPGEEIYPDTMNFNPAVPDTNLLETFGPGKILLFESAAKMPLYEIPKTNINLLKPDTSDPGSEPDLIRGNLPNAPVSAIKTNEDNTEAYSEIYIYV